MTTSQYNLLGFVSTHEIMNVFTTELDRIEEDIRVNGIPQNPAIFFEYFDDIRQGLIKKAQFNLESYLKKNPEIKQEIRDEREAKEIKESKQTWQERREKVTRTREKHKKIFGEEG